MTVSDLATTTALTTVDIANLKRAKTLSFFHQCDGTVVVRLTIKSNLTNQEYELRVPSIIYGGSSKFGGNDYSVDDIEGASFGIVTPEFSEEWRTVTDIVKAGDRLEVHWHMGGHTSQLLQKHGLVGDSIEIVIKKKARKDSRHPKPSLKFLLDVRITEKDSSARMFKFTK